MSKKSIAAILAGLAAIVILIYSPTLHDPFVWDDALLISDNAFIHDASNIKHLFDKRYFEQGIELSYRPAGTFLLMANYAAGHGSPEPFRVTSIILHCLATMLVFALIVYVLDSFSATGPALMLTAFAGAAIFAAHPVNTEAVNGVTFLEDPLCFIFCAASFVVSIYSRKSSSKTISFAALLLYSLALLSKETAAALPIVLFVFLCLSDNGQKFTERLGRSFVAVLPHAVITVMYLVLRFVIMKNPAEQMIYHGGGPFDTLLLTGRAWLEYIRLSFAPIRQCADYFVSGSPTIRSPQYGGGVACIVIVVAAAFALARKRPAASFGLFWFIVFLLPVSNIIPIGVTMAERYLYIPLAGLLVCAAAIAAEASSKAGKQRRLVPAAILLTSALLYGNLAYARNGVWRNEVSFWSDAAACSENSAAPLVNLGVAYFKAGKTAGAGAVLERAVEVASAAGDPAKDRYGTLYRAHGNLGMTLAAQGKSAAAERHLNEALRLNPAYAQARFNLAVLYLQKRGHTREAAMELEAGLSSEPRNLKARAMLAILYERGGLPGKAADQYAIMARLDPANGATYLRKASQLESRGGEK